MGRVAPAWNSPGVGGSGYLSFLIFYYAKKSNLTNNGFKYRTKNEFKP